MAHYYTLFPRYKAVTLDLIGDWKDDDVAAVANRRGWRFLPKFDGAFRRRRFLRDRLRPTLPGDLP
jgi:hypothetical protein